MKKSYAVLADLFRRIGFKGLQACVGLSSFRNEFISATFNIKKFRYCQDSFASSTKVYGESILVLQAILYVKNCFRLMSDLFGRTIILVEKSKF